jgi:hypothetical protein
MRVFNLTDVETSVLKQQALFNQHIAIGGRMSVPGEFIDVEDSSGVIRAKLVHLLTVGAVSIDHVPPAYAHAKQSAQSSQARHVQVFETKVPVVSGPVDVRTEAPVPVTRYVPSAEEEPPAEPSSESAQFGKGKKRTAGR